MSSSFKAALILQGKTAFNALSGFNRELASSLQSLGVEPVLLNLREPQQMIETFRAALSKYGPGGLVVFSFAGIGIELGDTEPQGNFWARLRLPVVNWLIDHPCHMTRRHHHGSRGTINLYVNHDFFDFQKTYVKSPRRLAFCPFGCFTNGYAPRTLSRAQLENPLVLFAKSGQNTIDIKADWAFAPPLMQRILEDAVDHYWGETSRCGPVSPSILAAADAIGVELSGDLALFTWLVSSLDLYIRSRKAEALFKQLLPFPVRIIGGDLKAVDTEGARAEIMGAVDYDVLTKMYTEALALISVNPNVSDEAHDRVFSAFGQGVLPVSDINPWIEKNVSEILPYAYDFRDRPLSAVLEKLFGAPEEAEACGAAVGVRMRKERPFSASVARALEIAEASRFVNSYEDRIVQESRWT